MCARAGFLLRASRGRGRGRERARPRGRRGRLAFVEHPTVGGFPVTAIAETREDAIDLVALLSFLARFSGGDFTARLPADWIGLSGKVADGLNEIISVNELFCAELSRVSDLVGREGKLSQRVERGG